MTGKLVQRNDKVAFYGVKQDGDNYVYHRMTGFTDISQSKNPTQYSRRYVDEAFEQTDVTGYSPSIDYSFDQYSPNPVHDDIVAIADGEMIGSDAVRPIVLVDMTKAGKAQSSFVAVKRDFAIIPDSEGSSTDAYTYSGSLRAKGERVVGEATSSDGWQTLTFSEDGE